MQHPHDENTGHGITSADRIHHPGYGIRHHPETVTVGSQQFRAGSTPRDLYIRIHKSHSGTPMPAFSGSDEDVWALIHFIGSLRDPNAPAPKHVSPGCGGMEVGR